jgi:hypothetical protein
MEKEDLKDLLVMMDV